MWGKGGKRGYGLSHIIERRNSDGLDGIDYVKNLPSIIEKGKLEKINSQPNIDFVRKENDSSLIKKVWDNKKRNWVVTAFKDKESLNKPTNRTPDIVNNRNEMTPSFGLNKDTNIITDTSTNLNPQSTNQSNQAPKSYQDWLDWIHKKRKLK